MTERLQFCGACAKKKPQKGGHPILLFGTTRRWCCSKCVEFRKRTMTVRTNNHLFNVDEKRGGHVPNSNSTPRLPGSRKRGGPVTGPVIVPRTVKVQVDPTPLPRFHVPEEFAGGFTAEWKRLRGIK
jgi:hypothetical protein